MKFKGPLFTDFNKHCSECGYPVNVEAETTCPDCGESTHFFEKRILTWPTGVSLYLSFTLQRDHGFWTPFYFWLSDGGGRSPAQPMLTPSRKTLRECYEATLIAITDCPEGWGLPDVLWSLKRYIEQ